MVPSVSYDCAKQPNARVRFISAARPNQIAVEFVSVAGYHPRHYIVHRGVEYLWGLSAGHFGSVTCLDMGNKKM